MNIIGFVPARSGSVGIKKKNLVKLNGKPLIKYTLDTLKKLKKKVYPFISTNDLKIKKYCESNGLKSNYLRPNNLSASASNIVDVVLHGASWLEKDQKIKIDAILLLQPTSPLRNSKEIIAAIKLFKKNKINSMASVSPIKEHPYESVEIYKNKNWKFVRKPKRDIYRRQQFINNFYYIDGNFYLLKLNFLKKNKSFIKENITTLFKLKRSWPVDIDNYEDLAVASAMLKMKKND